MKVEFVLMLAAFLICIYYSVVLVLASISFLKEHKEVQDLFRNDAMVSVLVPLCKQQRVGDNGALDVLFVEAFYGFLITYCSNLKWKAGSVLSLLEQKK
ncbi:hypothetical protein [Coprothermobacter proteolyticus]|uniref:hypothetical protein n=1 Tax=Coprothermobacter proteolyticus TaxID=35786 RepID=UPI000D30142A|nr:hypothetical protein [Coprothermobacter proteolyticus]